MIAGVSGAVARRLEVSPGVIRAIFIVTAFAGGFGLAAYVLGTLLIPAEGESRTPTRRWFDRATRADDWSQRIGWGLLTLAAVVVIASTGIVSTPLVLAGVLVALAVSLLDRKAN